MAYNYLSSEKEPSEKTLSFGYPNADDYPQPNEFLTFVPAFYKKKSFQM